VVPFQVAILPDCVAKMPVEGVPIKNLSPVEGEMISDDDKTHFSTGSNQ
jgi:hypothetical protein